MATPLIPNSHVARQRAQRQHILRTTQFGDSFDPSRSAVTPATARTAAPRRPVGKAPINVAVRVPIAAAPPQAALYNNGKLTRAAKQDCRHNNCGGMTDLVDDNHSIPAANINKF